MANIQQSWYIAYYNYRILQAPTDVQMRTALFPFGIGYFICELKIGKSGNVRKAKSSDIGSRGTMGHWEEGSQRAERLNMIEGSQQTDDIACQSHVSRGPFI